MIEKSHFLSRLVTSFAALMLLVSITQATTYTVINTNDNGVDSLRQAMLDANANPGADTINFNIPGGGPHTIALLSPLPTITEQLFLMGTSQPGYAGAPLIVLDGSGAGTGSTINGLQVLATDCTIKGFVIHSFDANGILLDGADRTLVAGNYIGTDATGMVDLGNSVLGIVIRQSDQCVIGGVTPSDLNLISGNSGGITIQGLSTAGNTTIQGNYIGTDISGSGNLGNNEYGISLSLTTGNLIGGVATGAGNVISGNGSEGILLGFGANSNTIQNNLIGTDATGMAAIGNGDYGIYLWNGASNNLIGGERGFEGNVISGNGSGPGSETGGIALVGGSGNTIAGNLIGVTADGNSALPNAFRGVSLITVSATYPVTGTTIGGMDPNRGNIISGNSKDGIIIAQGDTTGNTIQNNRIGTNQDGTAALGNGENGIWIVNAPNLNTVLDNLISGNAMNGIDLQTIGQFAPSNTFDRNYIGTDVTGLLAIPNGGHGIEIFEASNQIIGTPAGGGNIISGNAGSGIYIHTGLSDVAKGTLIRRNIIGLASDSNSPLPNGAHGVHVGGGAIQTTIGGLSIDDRNWIAHNVENGVLVKGEGALTNADTRINSNSIWSNGLLGIDIFGNGVTLNDPSDTDNAQNFPVITSVFLTPPALPGGDTSIQTDGTLQSAPNTLYRIELFGSLDFDPSFHGEGEAFLDTFDVTTDGSGFAAFSRTTLIPDIGIILAFFCTTATDPSGNTSEFSKCLTGRYDDSFIRYVDLAAIGANLGTDWTDALTDLQLASDVAFLSGGYITELWVAQGTYLPSRLFNLLTSDAENPRAVSFQLADGVEVYGGFAGTESLRGERDPSLNITTLSGDLNQDDTSGGSNAENAFHVVASKLLSASTILDGFLITGGNADGLTGLFRDLGGGYFATTTSSLMVRDCTFTENVAVVGGGVAVLSSSPRFENCRFVNNTATQGGGLGSYLHPTLIGCSFLDNVATDGGGIYIGSGTPRIINCLLRGNTAANGGGMYSNGAPTIVNCLITDNTASLFGGGIYNINALQVANCTIVRNTSPTGIGGGWYSGPSGSSYLDNSIFWNNSDSLGSGQFSQFAWSGGGLFVNYNCIEGWTGSFGGTGNIGSNPAFLDIDGPDNIPGNDDDDLHITPASSCIDAGRNSSVPLDDRDIDDDGDTGEQLPWDYDGNTRIVDDPDTPDTGDLVPPFVDMGAYELQVNLCPADTDASGSVNVTDLLALLAAWGPCPPPCPPDINSDGNVNVTDLLALLAAWGVCP